MPRGLAVPEREVRDLAASVADRYTRKQWRASTRTCTRTASSRRMPRPDASWLATSFSRRTGPQPSARDLRVDDRAFVAIDRRAAVAAGSIRRPLAGSRGFGVDQSCWLTTFVDGHAFRMRLWLLPLPSAIATYPRLGVTLGLGERHVSVEAR